MLLSCFRLIKAFTTKLRDDSISAFAAQAAFFIILSVFPFLMFLLTLINYLPFSVDELGIFSNNILPNSINTMLQNILNEYRTSKKANALSCVRFLLFIGLFTPLRLRNQVPGVCLPELYRSLPVNQR